VVSNWSAKRRHAQVVFAWIGVVLPIAAHRASADEPAVQEPLCIVCLGDSTTFGYSVDANYPKQLEQRLTGKEGLSVRVVNAGVNNDTTQGALKRLEKDVLAHRPDVVLIQFGLNDQTMRLYQKPEEITPYVALESFAENLKSIVQRVQRQGASPILLTPNLMIWTDTLEHHYPDGPYLDPPHGGNRLLAEYVTKVKDVAAAERVPVIDVFAAYDDLQKDESQHISEYFLPDGVHPSARGYALNVDLVVPQLRKMLRGRADDRKMRIGGNSP
jgi:lysophospholipase L1-like esterase